MENLENEHAFEKLQETRANNIVENVQPKQYDLTLRMLFGNHKKMFAFYKIYDKQVGFLMKMELVHKRVMNCKICKICM